MNSSSVLVVAFSRLKQTVLDPFILTRIYHHRYVGLVAIIPQPFATALWLPHRSTLAGVHAGAHLLACVTAPYPSARRDVTIDMVYPNARYGVRIDGYHLAGIFHASERWPIVFELTYRASRSVYRNALTHVEELPYNPTEPPIF